MKNELNHSFKTCGLLPKNQSIGLGNKYTLTSFIIIIIMIIMMIIIIIVIIIIMTDVLPAEKPRTISFAILYESYV